MATVSEALAIAVRHHQSGNLGQAEQIYRQILGVSPNHAQALYFLGLIAYQVGRHEAAAEYLARSIRLDGRQAACHHCLGVVYAALRRIPEAIACFERAIELDPRSADAYYNLGVGYKEQCKFDDAITSFRRALELRPDYVHARYDLGIALSRQGKLDEASVCFERTLLVKPDSAEAYNDLGLETIPRKVPYLSVDPRIAERWRESLSRHEGFRVGIVWQGSRTFRKDHLRSIPLVEFAPLSEVLGASLISLQKGFGEEQLAALQGRFPIAEAGEFDEYSGTDRAAILLNLDLLITSDTAMAHLAGAIGRPVWVALPFRADWRWLLQREDSPWYPTMRLFRQTSPGEWREVFRRMMAALAERVGGRAEG